MSALVSREAAGPRSRLIAGSVDDRPPRFRGDVEGLRAVAIGLVLLYHAGLPLVPAGFVGVDVFFVISGFLITTQLVSELDRTGRISLPRFYARRAKRLLPAAAVVLAVTVVLVRFLVPKVRWEEIGGDVVGSALYLVNWRLAERSVDYLAEDSEASPVQHFWSLAVEEQYYLVWPLLILVAAGVATVSRWRVRPVLWLGLAAVAIPSFGWALVETAHSPEQAFFVTTTRMWELAVGAGVALGAGAFAGLPKRLARIVGWAGLAAIGLSGVLFSTGTPWPGHAALLPTIGTAAVIAAGFAAVRGGPASLLATAPFRWVGGLSYSLYLWHWPLLAVAAAYWGELSAWRGGLLVMISFVPAWLTFRFVENPIRFSPVVSRSPKLALGLGAGFSLTGVAAGLVLLTAFSSAIPDRPPSGSALGAAVLADDPRGDPAGAAVDDVGWMTPDPLEATSDVPEIYARGCQQGLAESEVVTCEHGDRRAQTTVAIVGDSKIAQWLPALQLIADSSGWRLVTFTKSGCPFTSAIPHADGEPYPACQQWNQAVADRLRDDPPDYLLTSQGAGEAFDATGGELSEDAMVAGLRTAWSAVTEYGTHVVVVADNPHPGQQIYECVDANRDRLTACTYPRERYATSAAPTQRAAADGQRGVAMVDLFDAVCPTDPCAPVIGNVLIYRQGSHITATYIETLAPRMAAALGEVGMPTSPPRTDR